MGTTAEKLTYLSGTKDALKTTINYIGANITNDTFRSYADKLKLGYIDILNNGTDTLYSNLPKVSGKGSNLSLTPTYEAPMRNLPYGDTSQDGTPTPNSPIEIENVTGNQEVNICGKNLFSSELEQGVIDSSTGQPSSSTTRLRTKDFIMVSPNTQYTLSIAESNIQTFIYNYKNDGTYIDRTPSSWQNLSYTFTTGNNVEKIKVIFQKVGSATIVPSEISNIQLEKGSTSTTYEAYNGNTYEVNLGKNVFNFDNFVTKTENVSIVSQTDDTLVATVTTASTWQTIKYDINNLEENTDYVLRFNFKNTYNSDLYNHTWMTIKNSSNTNVFNAAYYKGDIITFNTGNSTTFSFVFHVTINAPAVVNTITISNVWLEKKTDVIELNKIGDYEDYIFKNEPNNPNYDSNLTLNSWYIKKNIGKVVLDGSNDENWGIWFSTTGVYYSANYISSLPDSGNTINCICDKYQANTRVYLRNNLSTIDGVCATNGGELIIANKSITSVSDFKTWLSNNNVIMYYIYARSVATTTEITNTTLISQLDALYNAKSKEGTTNISSTSENLPMVISASALKNE